MPPYSTTTAYNLGKEYKAKGRFRLSPFYENPKLDHYFYAGYDEINPSDITPFSPVGYKALEPSNT